MNSQNIVNQSYTCLDENPKIIQRTYDWNGKTVQFKLCRDHCQDPDFSDYVSEEKL